MLCSLNVCQPSELIEIVFGRLRRLLGAAVDVVEESGGGVEKQDAPTSKSVNVQIDS